MKKHFILLVRLSLFALLFSLGTGTALIIGESEGLALAELSSTEVGAFTLDKDTQALYAALNEKPASHKTPGIYQSLDDGRTWQQISPGPSADISALALNPINQRVLYAGTSGHADPQSGTLWRSTDLGRNWDAYTLRLPSNAEGYFPKVTVLNVDPKHPGYLYVGTAGQGLYRFDSDGYGYELLGGASLRNLHVTQLVNGHNGDIFALTTAGSYRISGDQWTKLDSLPGHATSLSVHPHQSDVLYAGTLANGLYRSEDGGQTWQNLSEDLGLEAGVLLRVTAISINPNKPEHIALATAFDVGSQTAPGHLYQSQNAGESWTQQATLDDVVTTLTINQGDVYAATQTGLVRYGEPTSLAQSLPAMLERTFLSPTSLQGLILAVTLLLSGLVLFGKASWLPQPMLAG